MGFYRNLVGMNCKTSGMGSRTATLLGGIGIGAALMYVLDPQGGRRRRAMARDKAVSFAGKTQEAVARRSRDLSNRARGVAAELRSALSREGKPEDGASAGVGADKHAGPEIEASREENGNGAGTAAAESAPASMERSAGRKAPRRAGARPDVPEIEGF